MVEALYMNDSYLKEWDAKVESVSQQKFVILDKTAFFPKGGGVEFDTGKITTEDNDEFNVVYTGNSQVKLATKLTMKV